nr:adenine DNA glycosylase isoform X1 [Ipomoea trifida]
MSCAIYSINSYFQTHCLAGKRKPSLLTIRAHRHRSPPKITSMDGGGARRRHTVASKPNKRPRRSSEARLKKEVPACEGDIEDTLAFTGEETIKIRASLLHWYDRNRRDLPWRRTSDTKVNGDEGERERRAYEVWVSEVMLQQTRVQTVIDYFNRWMQKWPTVQHLARASLEEVNEMWAGLGYYRRARFLLEGAKMIVEDGCGFPNTVSGLRKVKGIGEYTAGAIASIAFNEAVPIVDGNVARVIARLKAISANPKDTVTIKNFWKLAGQLVDPCRPGDLNQALMELGATTCSPVNPSCDTCPISTQCLALSLSAQDESVVVTDFPTKVVKAKQRHDYSAVSVVEILESQDTEEHESNSKFLIVKRPNEGLLAGLWEFPSVLLDGEADLASRRKATDNLLRSSFNLDTKRSYSVHLREHVGEYVHIFTHIRLKMYIELLVLCPKGTRNVPGSKEGKETAMWKYVDKKELSTMGLTSGVRKVYDMIQKYKQSKLDSISVKQRLRK